MNKIKNRVNHLHIKQKMLFYSYSIITPILLIICTVFMIYNYMEIQTVRRESNINDIQSFADGANIIFHDVRDLSAYLAISTEINKILTSDNVAKLNRNTRLWQQEAPMQVVEDMMALKGYIRTIAIYPENGITPFLRCTDGSSFLPTLQDVKETVYYQRALEEKGRSNWIHVSRGRSEFYFDNKTEKLVIYREIYDLTKKNPLAYLVLGITDDTFVKLCTNALQGENEGVILFNSLGEELTRGGIIPKEIETYFSEINFADNKNNEMFSVGSHDMFSMRDKNTGFFIYKIVPKINLTDMAWEIARVPSALLLGVLLGLLPVLILVSNIVSRPLRKVCDAMGNFKNGDFEQRLIVQTEDEVGEVANCFNLMAKDIKELIDKNYVMALRERESELAALQAQITPHFLYNTLDSLYWQANSAGNDEIAENIYALSQLFRLVLGKGQDEVQVKSEMELVMRYMEIQKMRFSKRLNFKIFLDESIEDELIPKLILQPFVENSVIHGIGNGENICNINVSARKHGNHIRFCVRDTGIGMSKEQIQSLWEEKQDAKTENTRLGHYAIYNVRERLQLKYKDDFTMKFESEKGKGTKVLLEIPIQSEL